MAGKWVVICTRRDENTAHRFVEVMGTVMRPMGIRMGNPQMIAIQQDRVDHYIAALRESSPKDVSILSDQAY